MVPLARVSPAAHDDRRLLVGREMPCPECAAREWAGPSPPGAGFPRPDSSPFSGAHPLPLMPPPRAPETARFPAWWSAEETPHDRLWRGFWSALWVVLGVSGLACAAAGVGGDGPAHVAAVRAFGWPALGLPWWILVTAIRRRTPAGRSPDVVLLVLGLTLEFSALAWMHDVVAVLLGRG